LVIAVAALFGARARWAVFALATAGVAGSAAAAIVMASALWRKHRIGEIGAVQARGLVERFESDFYGDEVNAPRFVVIPPLPQILDEAARLIAMHSLRAYDSVARRIDAAFNTFACFDKGLREAAISEGFTLLPE
jgi:predicted nucleic acid-binding protein